MAKLRYEHESLPSGRLITRKYAPTGELVEESHTYDNLDIGITLSFANGLKTAESYYCKGRNVGRKKYEQARSQYSDMPPADSAVEDGTAALRSLANRERREHAKQTKQHPPNPEAARESDSFCLELMKKPGCKDAVTWIQNREHTLGEMTAVASRRLVDKLGHLGAVTIHACEINSSEEGENTGHVVVELPDALATRADLLKEIDRLARKQGFAGPADDGQRYVYLKLD